MLNFSPEGCPCDNCKAGRSAALEREFTPIEKLFVQSADVLSQISRQIGDTEPEDTVFVIGLERAATARAKKLGYTGI